ncbi:MAG TPA: hypothetical protein PKK06_01760 [Phycisphaerae bacterium]|nr:hypothetical protein [Phycisphaerae bacterium]HNU44150.1 hypothetical protein [Phycisphaerae bacterium]
MLELIDVPGEVEICWAAGGQDPRTSAVRARALLAAVVSQARLDGMSQIRFRVAAEPRCLTMQYFGPSTSADARWWDMQAPPADCYPYLIQTVLSGAVLDEGLPLCGGVPARLRRRHLDVRFTLPAVEELVLTIAGQGRAVP